MMEWDGIWHESEVYLSANGACQGTGERLPGGFSAAPMLPTSIVYHNGSDLTFDGYTSLDRIPSLSSALDSSLCRFLLFSKQFFGNSKLLFTVFTNMATRIVWSCLKWMKFFEISWSRSSPHITHLNTYSTAYCMLHPYSCTFTLPLLSTTVGINH